MQSVDSSTWLPVSKLCICVMLAVFHILTVLSTVPPGIQDKPMPLSVQETFFSRKLPAVARTLDCQGHQETAFTADWWAVMLCSGLSRACNILNLNPSKLLKIVVEFKDCVAGPFSKKWPSPRFFHQPANPKAEHSCHCPRWQGCDHLSTKLSDRYQCLRESKSGQDCLSAKQEGAHLTHKPPVCAQSVCPPGVPQP